MEVSFKSKADSKRQREEEFLRLTPFDRVRAFITLCKEIYKLQPPTLKHSDNFIIQKPLGDE